LSGIAAEQLLGLLLAGVGIGHQAEVVLDVLYLNDHFVPLFHL